MAFLVEDGTGIPGANAGITVEFADIYHADRGNMLWVGDISVKQGAILRATGYTERRFSTRYKGRRKTREQGLSWPRNNAYDSSRYRLEGAPYQWQYAIAEYALRALLYGELSPDVPPPVPRQDNSGTSEEESTTVTNIVGTIKRRTEVFGPFEETTEYFPTSSTTTTSSGSSQGQSELSGLQLPEYPAADLWIEELVRSSRLSMDWELA